MNERSTNPNHWQRTRPWLLAVLGPLLWLATLRVTGLPDGENAHDAYYHATMGDLGPAVCMARRFPVQTLSIWNEHFGDKELLFHLLVGAVRWPRQVLRGRQPPFHVAQLFFAGGVLAAFGVAAWRAGVRRLWPWTFLLVLLSPFFTHRLLMLRPHLLALILMFAAIVVCARTRERRQLWAPALVGFVFAWSYSNPHFVLLPAAAFALARWRSRRTVAVALPLAAAVGVVLGFLIHPQVPWTFVNWKIQCVDVVLASLRGNAPVYLGTELSPPGVPWLIRNAAVYFLLAATLILAWRRRKAEGRWPETIFALLLMALITVLGSLVGLRAMEYAAPLTVLAAAVVWRDRPLPLRLALPVLAVLLTGLGVFHVERLQATRVRPLTGLAAWAEERWMPPATLVANPYWSDFPLLFHALPDKRFLFGIDPMFAYVANPDKVAAIERFRSGQEHLTPDEFADLTNARLAFVSHYGKSLSRDLYDAGWVIVYQGPDGWLFDLTQRRQVPKESP